MGVETTWMQSPLLDKNLDKRVCDRLKLPYERNWKFESIASGAADIWRWLEKRIIDLPSGSVVSEHNQVELRHRTSELAVVCLKRWDDLQGDERDGAKLLIECLGGSIGDLLTIEHERRVNNQVFGWCAAPIVFMQPTPTMFPMLRKGLELLAGREDVVPLTGRSKTDETERSGEIEGDGRSRIASGKHLAARRNLRFDDNAKKVFWGDNIVGVNQHSHFTILKLLHDAQQGIVDYAKLAEVIDPERNQVSKAVVNLKLTTAVRDAVGKIRGALKNVGCPFGIKNVRSKGYQLHTPDT